MARFSERFLALTVLAVFLFISGCATIEKAKKVDELEKRIDELALAVKEKDEQIGQLSKSLEKQGSLLEERESSYGKALDKLNRELNELKAKQKALEQQAQESREKPKEAESYLK